MKYAKLRGKIREKYGSEMVFSKLMGITKVTMSNRLNGKNGWLLEDAKKACELLDISLKDIDEYFFEK